MHDAAAVTMVEDESTLMHDLADQGLVELLRMLVQEVVEIHPALRHDCKQGERSKRRNGRARTRREREGRSTTGFAQRSRTRARARTDEDGAIRVIRLDQRAHRVMLQHLHGLNLRADSTDSAQPLFNVRGRVDLRKTVRVDKQGTAAANAATTPTRFLLMSLHANVSDSPLVRHSWTVANSPLPIFRPRVQSCTTPRSSPMVGSTGGMCGRSHIERRGARRELL